MARDSFQETTMFLTSRYARRLRQRYIWVWVIGSIFALLGGFFQFMTWPTVIMIVLLKAAAYTWFLQSTLKEGMDEIAVATRQAKEKERIRARSDVPLRSKIVQGFADPIMLIDPDLLIVEANLPALELFGERIIGQDLTLFLRSPDALDALSRATAKESPVRCELELSTPVRRFYVLSANRVDNRMAAEMGEDNEPPYYLVVSLQNITEAKLSEKMRVDFVANVSHELRTPLSSLIGFIETLQGPAQSDPQARTRFLGIMHDEADRMTRLIDDLLSLSRIELGKHMIPTDSFQVKGLLDRVPITMAMALERANREVRIDCPDDLPEVIADGDQILQVLQNLVGNSIKYAAPDTPISIKAWHKKRLTSTGQPAIAISVKDEGDGINPEHLPRLTERFYRVDTAHSRRVGGTGLGLAIVKHIIERHQGDLEIRSGHGEGVTITFALPIAKVDKSANLEEVIDLAS
ncbi:MAG: ATP-binding protein [Pseudomonadota bacterium]